ncbi:MAG: hypothetical protein EA397_01015 [Deltaproteobacteria bacterium]|nr:MAG: hypothetical protein EA397_01015 [Deltaproteobacteria bacterium]
MLLVLALTALGADVWSEPQPGVSLLERTTSAPAQRITAAYVDRCGSLNARATRYDERRQRTSAWGEDVGASVAINGAFFSYTDYDAVGYSVGEGEPWPTAWDHPDFTAIGFGSRGRARIWDPSDPLPPPFEDWWTQVVPGDPVLLRGGEVVHEPCYSHMCSRHPRTAVGLTDAGEVLLVTVDGRTAGASGMTRIELAELMRDLGATRALNFDGGGSTTLWVRGRGVVNVPSDGSERLVASHLGFVPGERVGCCERAPVDGASGLFADIPDGHWALPYAEALYTQGVTTGCQAEPRLFCPDCVLDRAHLGVLIARAADLEPSESRSFVDVASDIWYAGHLEALLEAEITSGCATDRYCPDRFATRFEAASFLVRAIGLPLEPPEGRFSDVTEAQAPLVEALERACVVSGCAEGRFCPDDEVSRAEAAKMIAVGLSIGEFAPCTEEEGSNRDSAPGGSDTEAESEGSDGPDVSDQDEDDDSHDGDSSSAEDDEDSARLDLTRSGCGCTSSPAPASWLALAIFGLLTGRRKETRH